METGAMSLGSMVGGRLANVSYPGMLRVVRGSARNGATLADAAAQRHPARPRAREEFAVDRRIAGADGGLDRLPRSISDKPARCCGNLRMMTGPCGSAPINGIASTGPGKRLGDRPSSTRGAKERAQEEFAMKRLS